MFKTASPHYLLAVPVFISIASLTVKNKVFIAVAIFSFLIILAFGYMKTQSWGRMTPTPLISAWQVVDGLILVFAGIYTAWQTSRDFKYTLKRLNRQIIEVSDSHSEIEKFLNYDALTGLVNRSYCEKLYTDQFNNNLKNNTNEQIAVFFLDLDNFKAINDSYDHTIGDKVLIEIANKLKNLTLTGGIACRLSGDEFVVIISRPIHYNVNLFAKRILQIVATPIDTGSNLVDITASVGIAVVGEHDKHFNEIRKKADLAMYKAKQSGKNNYYLYSKEMYQDSLKDMTIKNDLKKALKNGDLEVFLQPKVDIDTNKTSSAEALLRWTNNNEKNIGPAEFIPIIESTELISEIGEWVIHRSCQLCKELHDNGYTDISVAVNISASQLTRGNLETIIERELEASKLPAKYLELELTEYSIFNDNDDILQQLKNLKELGVMLSIDDFGTGYSNLEYLTKFNVDILKIDRSFIKEIPKSNDQYAIVVAIVNMAKALGLKVVAEGIETEKQLETLKELDCQYGQGFIWSGALPIKKFLRYLDQERLTPTKPSSSESDRLLTA